MKVQYLEISLCFLHEEGAWIPWHTSLHCSAGTVCRCNGSSKAARGISASVSCSCGLLRSPVASESSFIILKYATVHNARYYDSITDCALLPLAYRRTLLSFVSLFVRILNTGRVSRFVSRATFYRLLPNLHCSFQQRKRF